VNPLVAATWIVDVLQGELNYRGLELDAFSPSYMVDVIINVISETITEKVAVEIIRTVLDRGGSPCEIISEQALHVVPTEQVNEAVTQTIEENPQAVEDYHNGKKGAINFLVGQVMKKTRGRADPSLTNRLLRERL
ncbi:MAG: Asp-tRNA(Asn)/Glu-tRNA(Gln) amidotransferase GatCAB subunit B, partial [Euryarchaeota archaeon]|nr:Asp-tRNA(Asn)/Glu-tRNA(Gln) amidotransferase GatCAB subunit B [Euryarchaeota archaeon]